MEEEGDKRKGEKGKENVGTKEKEEEKAAGKRGNGTGKTGARPELYAKLEAENKPEKALVKKRV